jgi:hypothetical protein
MKYTNYQEYEQQKIWYMRLFTIELKENILKPKLNLIMPVYSSYNTSFQVNFY